MNPLLLQPSLIKIQATLRNSQKGFSQDDEKKRYNLNNYNLKIVFECISRNVLSLS